MKKFNINDCMYIQITEDGFNYLRATVGGAYIQHCIMSKAVNIENEVWYKLQCHEVFNLLPIVYFGKDMFNSNVMFDDCDLH